MHCPILTAVATELGKFGGGVKAEMYFTYSNKWGEKGANVFSPCRKDSSNNLLMEHEIIAALKIY